MRRFWLGVLAALLMAAPAQARDIPAAPLSIGQAIAGDLTPNDARRPSGKYEDLFALEGRAGARIDLRLTSEDFDTVLLVSGPAGYFIANDDDGVPGSTNSRLVLELPADGAYRIAVTSFRPGETGAYRLQASVPDRDAEVSRPAEAEPIAIGTAATGHLRPGDERLGSGEYFDRFRFSARRGQRVRIDAASADFDTYLILRRPDGTQDENDDAAGGGARPTDSRIDTVLAEDGVYELLVTSFRPGETGKYRLTLQPSPGHPRHVGVPGGRRVLALLVGVADYGGRTSNLRNTDEDARRLHRSLDAAGLLHPASILLTNEEATTKAVAGAFARMAAAAGPEDLFLFFFSGHGDQIDIAPSARELDGRSETIELYDEAMTDAELAPLFASVRGRLSLVAIDACYAGGFRNLIDRPNVMGLFSSEEDLTSLVADRFKAGGFLAYYLRAGLGGEADEDGDRIVTAGELATYVRRRFRREGDIPATTREDERNYQNLIVERGGVHIEDVIVRLPPETRADAVPPSSPALAQGPAKRARAAAKE